MAGKTEFRTLSDRCCQHLRNCPDADDLITGDVVNLALEWRLCGGEHECINDVGDVAEVALLRAVAEEFQYRGGGTSLLIKSNTTCFV